MEDPKLQLVTPSGLVPLTGKQLRAVCANPRTMDFTIYGVSRRWLYDLLAQAPGWWSINIHPVNQGVKENLRAGSTTFWLVKRKKPASDRGILMAALNLAVKELNNAVSALVLELRHEEDAAEVESEALSLEDFGGGEAAGPVTATTFASLMGALPKQEDTTWEDADG